LEKEGFDPAMGARPLARLINEKIKLPMARHLLSKENIAEIHVNYVNDEVTFNFMEKANGVRTAELPKPEMVS